MKNLFVLLFSMCVTGANAQVVVDSLGKLEVSPLQNPPEAFLPLSGYSTTIRPLGHGGIFIQRPDTDNHGSYTGINVNVAGWGPSPAGIKSHATSGTICTYGVKGTAANASNPTTPCIGTYGGLSISGSFKGAGVYGATTTDPSNLFFPDRVYAGYFAGDVRVTGTIYGTILSPTSLLGTRGGNTTLLREDDNTRVTDKLLGVEVLQTLRTSNDGSIAADKEQKAAILPEIDRSSLTEEQLRDLESIENTEEPVQTKLSTISYGLAADQLKEVYPELVYEDDGGNFSINYIEMIPLLVQSIKELSQELSELKGASPKKLYAKTLPTGIEETVSDIDVVRMDQNNPNPFSESTVIALNIPAETHSATIFIYDMSGKQVQSLSVAERGETNITVYARDLSAGMYIYTLVADGKASVTRKMIVTKES